MTNTPEDRDDILYREARKRARQKVAELLKDTDLRVRELNYELLITNPKDPEKGQIHVAYADGYVSWERVAWDYWGQLEGLDDGTERKVPVEKIISTLTTPDPQENP